MPPRFMLDADEVDIQTLSEFYQSMPARILAGAIRMNTLLHKDEWQLLDACVLTISSNVLRAIAEMRAMGIVTNLRGLGVLVSQYEQVPEMSEETSVMALQYSAPLRRIDLCDEFSYALSNELQYEIRVHPPFYVPSTPLVYRDSIAVPSQYHVPVFSPHTIPIKSLGRLTVRRC